ncbi:nickel/cobalt transporter [Aureimonas flava]|uniref:Nickel/cobalt efflux system n=1 Tax=Aureimonas flava TaxID=2320271 RepID=A0A3A1WKX9_9HYPH|nr:nickel/cobalt transporter [Aureimonas flava]RIY01959.1 nickel/cobalt transporter [Aureimonas flava]
MQGGLTRLAAALCLLLAAAAAAHAQSSLGIGSAEATPAPSGPFAGLMMEILAVQRAFFVDLRQALVALRDGHGGFAWLAGLSFVYGVFHAAGPGHGKAVLSSYMLANEVALRRGVVLSFAAALVQALSAVAVVALGWFVLRGSGLSMTELAFGLELGSYAMIALVGAWLLVRKGWPLLRGLMVRVRTLAPAPRGGLAFAGRGTFTEAGGARQAGALRASGGYGADICDDPAGDACDCGRPHILEPTFLASPAFSWRAGLATVVAIGLRPCSGAIVVLTFALMNGLYGAGGLSVLAMALGTAITVSAIAAIAVSGKGLALLAGRGGAWGRGLRTGLEAGGALLLVAVGLGLLLASLPR